MLQQTMDISLTKQQKNANLYLEEEGDDYLLLKQGEIIRACFLQTKVTFEEIGKEADKWI